MAKYKLGDALLVSRAKRGDAHAFALLVERYRGKLARLLARMVYDPAEVEDLTQETLIKAYRALPAFRGDSAFYTWLYRIGVNVAKNHLVAMRRRLPAAGGTDEPEEGLDVDTPERALLAKELAHTVSRAIERLPAELATAIRMRELEVMSYGEIACEMACPLGTVRSRVFRARAAIAERLAPLLDPARDERW